MANAILRLMQVYGAWLSGGELSEDEVYEASSLLGTPTRKVDAFVERYSAVMAKLIEERCAEAAGGRMCIYTWSRRAYKRYFPAALDAGGTVLFFRGAEEVELVSYPLHRALDLGVRGVELPSGDPVAVTPRLDGWQVNLYYDPILKRWTFSTRYVLHNMRFERGRLVVEDYGKVINPLVETAERLSQRLQLHTKLEELRNWTLTLMLVGPEPATAVRSLPDPDFYEDYKLVLLAARRPDGRLVEPYSEELGRMAAELGLESIASSALRGLSKDSAAEMAERSLETPSAFLWYTGDPEHPPYYEVKSSFYAEYIEATRRMDGKALVVLLTSGDERVVAKLEEELGPIVGETREALRELEEALASAQSEAVEKSLRELGFDRKVSAEAARALKEGKASRALRVVAANLARGIGVGEVAEVLRSAAGRIRGLAAE
jgi:hypothetical protein